MTPAITAAVIRTVALTLRQLATWCVDGRSEMTDSDLRALAVQVEQIEPGWCCPMCEEVVCDGGCPLEPVRDHDSAALRQLVIDGQVIDPTPVTGQYGSPETPGRDTTEPDTAAVPGTDDPEGWQLTCYGDPADEFDTLDQAIPAADDHIRNRCPHGPMPWATRIEWHCTTLAELNGTYCSTAGGSWLNHHLRHPEPKITPPGPPPSAAGSDVSRALPRGA